MSGAQDSFEGDSTELEKALRGELGAIPHGRHCEWDKSGPTEIELKHCTCGLAKRKQRIRDLFAQTVPREKVREMLMQLAKHTAALYLPLNNPLIADEAWQRINDKADRLLAELERGQSDD